MKSFQYVGVSEELSGSLIDLTRRPWNAIRNIPPVYEDKNSNTLP
jgi:hypothetical protein